MKPIQIVGMGLSPDDLTAMHLEVIGSADVLVGGKRHLEYFPDHNAEKREIKSPISEVIEYVRQCMKTKSVVVLASGDPLFYGIGKALISSLGPENVEVHPNITTVSAAFARIRQPWQDATLISMHGKDGTAFLRKALELREFICVLTDNNNTPAAIAKIVNNNQNQWDMCILEKLGTPDERVEWMTSQQAAGMEFAQPNIVILRPGKETSKNRRLCLGTPDHWYAHENGLITKAPVRAVSLSTLRLQDKHILWDLGAGSGSVGIEASLFIRKGKIFSVEKNAGRIQLIEINKKKFSVDNMEIVQAELPDGLSNLPSPDRVFVGGGGKNLVHILEAASEHLRPNGIIVANTVLIENISKAETLLDSLGFKTQTTHIQVNTGKKMPWGHRMEALNPVWIISGRKEE